MLLWAGENTKGTEALLGPETRCGLDGKAHGATQDSLELEGRRSTGKASRCSRTNRPRQAKYLTTVCLSLFPRKMDRIIVPNPWGPQHRHTVSCGNGFLPGIPICEYPAHSVLAARGTVAKETDEAPAITV